MEIWSDSFSDAETSEPAGSDRVSAEYACSSRFWMMMDSPKVTSRVDSGPTRDARWMSPRWVR
jgi:hypothetical protein